ncbi:MAG: hypothetical protein ACHQF2_04530 [Flavobacteriales bacterium]
MNNIRIGGVDEAFNIPWKRVCADRKHALKLQWKDFEGGTGQLMRALNQGEIDMAVALTEGAVLDIVKNNKAAILCFYVLSPLEWGIHVSRKSGIKKIEEIKDKTIAISRFGSGSHLMPMVMGSELGWDVPAMRFHESLNLHGGIRDLITGTAHVFFWEKHTTAPYLETNDLECIGSYVSKWSAFSVAVRKDECKTNKELFQSVLTRVLKEAAAFKADPNSIAEIASFYKMPPATATQWMNRTNWISRPAVSPQLIQIVLLALKKGGLINALPSATSCICE